jgi:hypothetical protein
VEANFTVLRVISAEVAANDKGKIIWRTGRRAKILIFSRMNLLSELRSEANSTPGTIKSCWQKPPPLAMKRKR